MEKAEKLFAAGAEEASVVAGSVGAAWGEEELGDEGAGSLGAAERLPMGALLRLRKDGQVVLSRGRRHASGDGEGGGGPPRHARALPHTPTKSKHPDKHAPPEMSSKVPVGRLRMVCPPKRLYTPRDPRFDDLSGRLHPEEFHRAYAFLDSKRGHEIRTLRRAVHRGDFRGDRAAEIDAERVVSRLVQQLHSGRKHQAGVQKARRGLGRGQGGSGRGGRGGGGGGGGGKRTSRTRT